MEYDDGDTKCSWYTRNNPERFGKEAGRVENRRKRGDHPNYRIMEIGQNTEEGPGDLSLAISQTSVKDHQISRGVIQ